MIRRAVLWLLLHIPSGAGWRYSRFALVRRAGDWWLPRWYSFFRIDRIDAQRRDAA